MYSHSLTERQTDQPDTKQLLNLTKNQDILSDDVHVTLDDFSIKEMLSESELRQFFKIISNNTHSNYPVIKTLGSSSLMAGFGLSTASPYIQSAKLFAKGNVVLEYMLPAGELVSLGFLNTWLLKDILSTYSQPVSKDYPCGIKAVLIICPTILGAATSLPSVLISMSYNNEQLWLAGFAFLGDLVSNTYSFNRIAHDLIHNNSRLAQEMSYRLRLGLCEVINLSDDNINKFISEKRVQTLFNPDTLPNDKELMLLMKDLIVRGCQLKAQRDQYSGCYHNSIRTLVTYGVAALLPLTWVPAAFKIVFDDVRKLAADKVLTSIVSLCTTGPLYLLVALLGKSLVDDAWDLVADIYSGTFKRNFAQKNYLALTVALSGLALFFAGFSFGTTSLVIQDKFPGLLGEILVPLVSSILVSIRAYALLKCVNEAIFHCATVLGSHQDMAKFARLVQDLADNLPNLPHDKLATINHNLALRELISNDTNLDEDFVRVLKETYSANDVIFVDDPVENQIESPQKDNDETSLTNETTTNSSWFSSYGSLWKQSDQADRQLEDIEEINERCSCSIM